MDQKVRQPCFNVFRLADHGELGEASVIYLFWKKTYKKDKKRAIKRREEKNKNNQRKNKEKIPKEK